MTDCDVNCHKKCEKLTANLCGVNQKLIVEALSSVRRGNLLLYSIKCCIVHENSDYSKLRNSATFIVSLPTFWGNKFYFEFKF